MYWLGWDCACRTLAHVLLEINEDLLASCLNRIVVLTEHLRAAGIAPLVIGARAYECVPGHIDTRVLLKMVVEINNDLNKCFIFHSFAVVDICPNEYIGDVFDVVRAKLLHKYLNSADIAAELLPRKTIVVIECQPSKMSFGGSNLKSSAVSQQLAFYYCDYNARMVSPKLKNNIVFAGETLQKYQHSNKYIARKNHSKALFCAFMRIFDCEYIKNHVPVGCLDDLADAFLQIFVARAGEI